MEVGERGDRENRQDADHHDHHDRLGSRHGLGAHDIQSGHNHQKEYRKKRRACGATVADGRTGVAAERHGHHGRDDGVGEQKKPGDDPQDVPVAEALVDVFEHAARGGVAGRGWNATGAAAALSKVGAAQRQRTQNANSGYKSDKGPTLTAG